MSKNKSIFAIFLGLCIVLVMSNCGSDSASSSSGSAAFPSTLAIASPTASSSRALPMGNGRRITALQAASTATYATKKAALATMLAPTTIADCAFTLTLTQDTSNDNCYGPSVTYTNHPDADGSAPGGDLGIYTTSASDGSACAAAQLNKKVTGIASQVDTAIYTMASVFCIAKVNGTALPETGATIDLTTAVSTAYTTNAEGLTVSSATVTRNTDTSEGFKSYTTSLVGTTGTKTFTLRLKHIPTASDSSTFKGKLSYTLVDTATITSGNCTARVATTSGSNYATSIAYEQASSTNLKYQLQSGYFCGSDANPYVSATNYTVDPSKTHNTVAAGKGWGDNFNFALFNLNPNNGTGNFQFAWQAGNGDSNTRALNVSITDTAGTIGGCGYFGFGTAATAGISSAKVAKFICNWLSGSHTTGSNVPTKAQRQCMTKNASGLFTSTAATLAITYAPTTSCDAVGGFVMTPNSGAVVNGPVTNNLYSISSITDLTDPSAPADVDA